MKIRFWTVLIGDGDMKGMDRNSCPQQLLETSLVDTIYNMMLPEELYIIENVAISKGMAGAFTDSTFGRRRKFPTIILNGMDGSNIASIDMPVIGIGGRGNIKI